MKRFLASHPAPRLMLEAGIVVAAYVIYNLLRIVVEGGEAQAVENAFDIVALERAFGLFREAELQQWVEGHPWLDATMRWIYLHAYLPWMGLGALVVYLRDRELYRRYRNVLFMSALIGLVIFAILPVAPPRMLHEFGFIDETHVTVTSGAKNDFAAVPSFHFGFTLLVAMGIAHAFAWRGWLCALLALPPIIMLFSIVATANHFFIDAAAGAAVVLPLWWFFVRRPDDEATESEPVAVTQAA